MKALMLGLFVSLGLPVFANTDQAPNKRDCEYYIPTTPEGRTPDILLNMEYELSCTLSKSPGTILANKKFRFKPLIGNPRFVEYSTFDFTTNVKDSTGKVIDTIKAHVEGLVRFELDNSTEGQFKGGCTWHGKNSLSSKAKNVSSQVMNSNNTYGTDLYLILSNKIITPDLYNPFPEKSYKLSCQIDRVN